MFICRRLPCAHVQTHITYTGSVDVVWRVWRQLKSDRYDFCVVGYSTAHDVLRKRQRPGRPACNARERVLGKDVQWKRRNKGRPVYLELESTGVGGFYLKHRRRETVDFASPIIQPAATSC